MFAGQNFKLLVLSFVNISIFDGSPEPESGVSKPHPVGLGILFQPVAPEEPVAVHAAATVGVPSSFIFAHDEHVVVEP